MKHEGVTEDSQGTAALYALGALSQTEARAFEAHISEGCSVCEAELADFEQVVGQIGFGAEEQAPSPYLRDILTTRLEREARVPVQVTPFPGQTKVFSSQPARPRASFARTFLTWAIAASVAIFALVSFLAWRQSKQQIDSLRQDLVAAQNRNRDLETQGQSIRLIRLAGQEPAPSSSAEVYWEKETNRWFVNANLPQPPAGKVYQLWFVTPTEKISAGLIKPCETGRGSLVVNVPPNIGQLMAVAITLEPEGGSAQPTMPIYALGTVG